MLGLFQILRVRCLVQHNENTTYFEEQFPACATLQGAKFGANAVGILYGSLDVLVGPCHIGKAGFMVNTSPHNIGRRGLSGIHKGYRNATDKGKGAGRVFDNVKSVVHSSRFLLVKDYYIYLECLLPVSDVSSMQ